MIAALGRLFDTRTREAQAVTILTVVLVLARSAVFFAESISFDSDQAVVGLMAKHLSEFRAVPLFYYGLNYMLAVQAWLAAPLFWIFRPSVAVLRLPFVVLNVVAALVLIRVLCDELKLRPAVAMIATLPFIMPTPLIAAGFVQTSGVSVEPVIYVVGLWLLRTRPVLFGVLLAIGSLHREFTLYALPALAIVEFGRARASWRTVARSIGLGVAAFALVWLVIDDARMHLDGISLTMQAQQMEKFACLNPRAIGKARDLFREYLPTAAGTMTMPVEPPMRNAAIVGWPMLNWLIVAGLLVMAARTIWHSWTVRERQPAGFGLYLAIIGAITIAVYPISCGAQSGGPPILRYLHLAVLLPIGWFAVFAARERSSLVRAAAAAVFVIWAASALVDHGRVVYAAVVRPEVDPHRELADYLVDHQIRYARAPYWDAYIVDFFAREKVVVTSDYPIRVPEYERLVQQYPFATVNIERLPCQGQYYVSQWCIQAPER